jgi:heat-inducible transcriptional repressor
VRHQAFSLQKYGIFNTMNITKTTNNDNASLNERAQRLLKVLIERYIQDGQPVGSKTLAEDVSIGLSSATIRNIMADLEAGGYIHSPHTSAGRIPTSQGYRFFVDSLLTVRPLNESAMMLQQARQQLTSDMTVQNLVSSASSLLSGITQLVGLVSIPRRPHLHLRHVEFLPLSDNRVLVILVFNASEVQNRIIKTERTYTQKELQQASNYLNALYAGKDLSEVRRHLLQAMQADRQHMDSLMQAAIDMADKALDVSSTSNPVEDYVMAGQNQLFDMADLAGMQRLRQLFEAFTEKRLILHLLDQCLKTDGVQIYIGGESGYDVLNDCSMVTAPYMVADQVVGAVGVIGPTRMAYDRVIPMVDITAKLLSAVLNQAH